MPEPDELLTVPEAAARVKVNPETVRRWIKSGKLPAARPFGGPRGPYRIHSADIERLFGAAPKAVAPPEADEVEERRDHLSADERVSAWEGTAEIFRDSGGKVREDLGELQAADEHWSEFVTLSELAGLAFGGAERMADEVGQELGTPQTEEERRMADDMRSALAELKEAVRDALDEAARRLVGADAEDVGAVVSLVERLQRKSA